MTTRKKTKTDAAQARLIDAAMALAAEKDWRDITLTDIADRAAVPLAEARAYLRCKGAALRLLARRIDEKLLESVEKEPPEGEPIDRLFDVIMRRLELLAPYRAAVRRLLEQPVAVLADCPLLAPGALVSQRWMLAAAGLEKPGVEGCVKTAGLELVWLKTLRAWVDDDDPGLAKTMAALDKTLRNGETWLKRLEVPMRAAEAALDLGRTLACMIPGLCGREKAGSGAEAGDAPRESAESAN